MAEEAAKFLETKLRPDYAAAIKQLEDVQASLHDLDQLRHTIELLEEHNTSQAAAAAAAEHTLGQPAREPYKQLVDVGAGNCVVAEAEDSEFIFMKIGLGFFLQVTLAEAGPIMQQQADLLKK